LILAFVVFNPGDLYYLRYKKKLKKIIIIIMYYVTLSKWRNKVGLYITFACALMAFESSESTSSP